MNPRLLRNSFIYLLILVALVSLFFTVFSSSSNQEMDISTLISMAKEGKVQEIRIKGDNLDVTTTAGDKLSSRQPAGFDLLGTLREEGVKTGPGGVLVAVEKSSSMSSVFGLLLNFLPIIIFGALLLFMMRQAQGTNTQAMSFGRSRARLVTSSRPTVTFGDVAGVDEATQELQEVVEFLKYPERFTSLGARVPRGVLLVGPPGSGKTLLARAVAGEAGVPFFSISGSEFVEMFVGVGASRVRDLFDQAKRNAPCIVFVDEIDAVGRHRGAGLGGGHDEREQTLNQILVEMDGFDTSTNVIVLAATNRPDILDPALLRPGRFDRRVVLDQPDIAGRKAILQIHIKGKPLEGVDLELLARQTVGFSGADLANLVNEAAILAARRQKKTIGWEEMEEAIDRVVAGPERKSRIISAKEKEIAAYHEAGHALVARRLPHADPVHKVSIVARGLMGGYTRLLPTEDRHIYTRSQFQDMLATALAGHAAEDLVFGEITTGPQSDLEQATQLARRMITEFGMSEPPRFAEMAISAVIEEMLSGNVVGIDVFGDDLLVHTKDGSTFKSRKEHDFSLAEFLETQKEKGGHNSITVRVMPSGRLGGLGARTFGKKEELVFLGKEISEQRNYGDKVAEAIDEEMEAMTDKAYATARSILIEERARLDYIARTLIQKETLEGPELEDLFTLPVPQEVKV
ncbi:MAG: ATP-dependent zinc metalloprotease FtsH [Chloroflexi bacterium]|nr:ATP-dependent zinc metalloprotease FtsH [Chloroflexota bacterium]